MDLFFQGVGFCATCIIGAKFGKTFYPYFFKKNISLLKSRYNPNGDSFALITGSSDGVGKEFAKMLAQQNINIILHGRNQTKLNAVKNEILSNPLIIGKNIQVEIFEQNLSEQGINIEEQANKILSKYKISLLINNAGITSVESLFNSQSPDLLNIINTNAIAPVFLSKYIIQNQFTNTNEEYGIINISSLTADYPIGYLSTYSASKSFLNAFSQSLQQETTPNIQVTSLKPYYISTKMTRFQKLGFDTISTQDFVSGALNSLLHKQDTSCGNWKHQIIDTLFSVLPISLLSQRLTKNMEHVAQQHHQMKLIQMKREKAKMQRQNASKPLEDQNSQKSK